MKKHHLTITLVVLLAVSLPYLLAAFTAGRDWVFAGLLYNPIDGASYLAKMQEGYQGAWRFTLPYTADPGSGGYLFLFYLFLGHVANWLGVPLIFVYHAARMFGALALLLAIFQFYGCLFEDRPDLNKIACWLAAIGSGMGWLLLFLGSPPTDFWVAEAYPFLSMLTNPHFSLGLALLLWGFSLLLRKGARFRTLQLILIGLLISIIMPFGVVVILMVAAAWLAWEWLETKILDWQPVLSLGILGGPYLLYQFWIAQADPVLAGWNAQNVNLSPWLWDFLFSFSPALILSGFGLVVLSRRKDYTPRRLLITWLVLGLFLIYLPTPLQRRFMLGFYVPTAALAVFGIEFLRQKLTKWQQRIVPAVFLLALPTNLLLILMACVSAFTHPPLLYLTRDEADAMQWININSPRESLVLASPEMSQFIPALTGRRVIYGHPYETVNAALEEDRVNTFYRSFGPVDERIVLERNVNYILFGPRERLLGGDPDLSAHLLLYQAGDVRIFAGEGAP